MIPPIIIKNNLQNLIYCGMLYGPLFNCFFTPIKSRIEKSTITTKRISQIISILVFLFDEFLSNANALPLKFCGLAKLQSSELFIFS